MHKTLFILITLFLTIKNLPAQEPVKNVFLITLDGMRWQELFGGAVDSMMQNEDLTPDKEDVWEKFYAGSREEARKKLMPWFWSTLERQGLIYGNRWKGSKANCSNDQWFSYPGYNEILTGAADPAINSNAKKYNKNVTVLEWLNNKPGFAGKVAAFCSWDVFPYIINDQRSGIPVNAGFGKAKDQYLTYTEQLLNTLQDEIPSPWSSVRLDAFTHHFMMEYVKKHHPRVVYIAYGETDDFAHNGRYDHYLRSAHQTDQWIGAIWDFIQSDPFYKDNTSIIITTDHGRGHSPMTKWKGHGEDYPDSDEIWIAAIGPNVSGKGEISNGNQLYQNQVAGTLAKLLGLEYNGTPERKAGSIIKDISK